MAAYISVPRDLTRVKSKVLFNLTKRQLLCFGAGALVGVPAFFLLKQSGNVSLAAIGMMIIMLPMFFLGMYEKHGQPLEVIAKQFIEAKFIRPKVRPYQTNNYYAVLMRQAWAEQEGTGVLFALKNRKKQTEPSGMALPDHSDKAGGKSRFTLSLKRRSGMMAFPARHSSPSHFRGCSRTASVGSVTAITRKPFSFRTSTISWLSRRTKLPFLRNGAAS